VATSLISKRRRALTRWIALLRNRFPLFSVPQIKGLALWSIGIVLGKAASLHAVVLALVCWLSFNPFSLYKRLQEWYLEAAAKKGHGSGHAGFQRRDWDPHAASPHLLHWILEDWPTRQLVLVLDPTNFGARFTVLNISVLYRACAVPVIWTVVEGGEPGAWEPHWERMLQTLASSIPAGWQVLVLTDRGMYSPRLFGCLVRLHWHPFLRIRAQGFYRRAGRRKWLNLEHLHPTTGQTEAWQGEVFKNEEGRLKCTLVAYHGADYAEPWLIVTDLLPEVAQASWYGLRGWVEQGYRRVKGEGWRLPRTRITDRGRLERLWLAMAVATLWVLEVGGEAEIEEQQQRQRAKAAKVAGVDTPELPDLDTQGATAEAAPAPHEEADTAGQAEASKRIWSVFARGWNVLKNALAAGILLLGSWHPEVWPGQPMAGLPPTPQSWSANAEQVGTGPAEGAASEEGVHREDSG
jgi:Transposase DDE domain